MIRALLARLVGVAALRAWTQQQLRATTDAVRDHVRSTDHAIAAMTKRVEQLAAGLDAEHARVSNLADRVKPLRPLPATTIALGDRVALLETLARANDEMAPRVVTLARMDMRAVQAHAARTIRAATLQTTPGVHAVIDNVFPPDFYQLLIDTLPPAALIQRDGGKDFRPFGAPTVPAASRLTWQVFETDIIAPAVRPALLDLFASVLPRHYARIFAPDLSAEAVRLPTYSRGRVMLRGPGYHLKPHLDPKRVVLTGILYLARPGDNEAHGTQLFHVDRPFIAPYLKTYYPEEDGAQCTPAVDVAFRPNRLLAFLNADAAHGAHIPAGAEQKERFAYQFYVKMAGGALLQLIRRLPDEQRGPWRQLVEKDGDAD